MEKFTYAPDDNGREKIIHNGEEIGEMWFLKPYQWWQCQIMCPGTNAQTLNGIGGTKELAIKDATSKGISDGKIMMAYALYLADLSNC